MAAVKNLVTLEEFKIYKNINSTEQDTLINNLIERVSAQIKDYCNRSLIDYYTTNKIEYFNATNDTVFLREYPILSVSSVKTSSDGGSTFDTTLTEYTDFYIDYDTGEVTSALSAFLTTALAKSNRTLQIIYRGGYKKLPTQLRQAALDLVEYYRQNQYTPRQDFQDFSNENVGFRAQDAAMFPSHIRRIIDHYREI